MTTTPLVDRESWLDRIRKAYRKASGGSLLLSIGIHAAILLVGAYFVVSQITEERKISFGGGETGPKSEVQHKVKPKTIPAAPVPNKRITTTSATAKVALPDMPNVSLNMGPSIAGSMNSGELKSVAGLGVAGSGFPSGKNSNYSKITFFGLRADKNGSDGLVGTFYDLKQKPDGSPTKMEISAAEKANPKSCLGSSDENKEYDTTLRNFVKNWSMSLLDGRYFKASEKLAASQIIIPIMPAGAAPKEYGVEKECEPRRWIACYTGTVLPPRDGRFRFRGFCDDVIVVRCNGQNVFDGSMINLCKDVNSDPVTPANKFAGGKWINMHKGVPIEMKIIIGERPGGVFMAFLCIEEEGGKYSDGYPVFQVKEGTVPPHGSPPPLGFPIGKETMVFQIQKKGAKSAIGSLFP